MNRLLLLIILVSCFGSIHAVDDYSGLESYKTFPEWIKKREIKLSDEKYNFKMSTFFPVKDKILDLLGYKSEFIKTGEGGYAFNEREIGYLITKSRVVGVGIIEEIDTTSYFLGKRVPFDGKFEGYNLVMVGDNLIDRTRIVIKIEKVFFGMSDLLKNKMNNKLVTRKPIEQFSDYKKGDNVIFLVVDNRYLHDKRVVDPYYHLVIFQILPNQKYGRIVYDSTFHENSNTLPYNTVMEVLKKIMELGNKIRVEEGLKPID